MSKDDAEMNLRIALKKDLVAAKAAIEAGDSEGTAVALDALEKRMRRALSEVGDIEEAEA